MMLDANRSSSQTKLAKMHMKNKKEQIIAVLACEKADQLTTAGNACIGGRTLERQTTAALSACSRLSLFAKHCVGYKNKAEVGLKSSLLPLDK